MTIAEVLELIKTNPEYLEAVKKQFIKPEELLESKDPAVRSVIDRAVQKGIDGFKEKGMVSILEQREAEWKKKHFDEFAVEHKITIDPAAKAMEERIAALKKKEQDLLRREKVGGIKNKLVDKISKAGLDVSVVDLIHLDDDETKAMSYADALLKVVNDAIQNGVKSKLRINDTHPDEGSVDFTARNPFSKKHFNLTRQAELLEKDPAMAKTLEQQAIDKGE